MAPKRKTDAVSSSNKKPKVADDFADFYKNTLDVIASLRDETGERDLVGAFQKLPSKKLYPDYYQIIAEPISISEILKKVAKGKYSTDSTDEFVADFQKLLDNATLYNDPESWIVQDATQIVDFVKEQVEQFGGSHGGDEVTNENLPQLATDLVTEVVEHEFPEIGVISGPFLEDIDRKAYPDYFKIIQHPTSFNKVLSAIKKKKLFNPSATVAENLDTLFEEVDLIFKNAQTYNDPLSLLHQDALTLQKYFHEKIEELRSRTEKPKLTLKLKPKKEQAPKMKLKLKQEEPVEIPQEQPKKKKRGRPPLKKEPSYTEPSPEPEINDEFDEDDHDKETAPVNEISKSMPSLSTILGKTLKPPSAEEAFIRELSLSSTSTTVSQLVSDPPAVTPLLVAQQVKSSLFPSHYAATLASVLEYKFATNGYSSQSYSLSMPPDADNTISLKVLLHPIIHDLKKNDLVEGLTYLSLSSDEDFQFHLSVNDNKVTSGGEVFEERIAHSAATLAVQYDLKLSYGLNVLEFEMNIAPNLAKKVKTGLELDVEESAGRHTRHQLQQAKMNWEVEKFTLYVVSTSQ